MREREWINKWRAGDPKASWYRAWHIHRCATLRQDYPVRLLVGDQLFAALVAVDPEKRKRRPSDRLGAEEWTEAMRKAPGPRPPARGFRGD